MKRAKKADRGLRKCERQKVPFGEFGEPGVGMKMRYAVLSGMAWLVHGVLAGIGIVGSGSQRVDLMSRGRAVVFLQATRVGRRLSQVIRAIFPVICVLTLEITFSYHHHHAAGVRAVLAMLYALLTLTGPLSFAALSYRRWLTCLLVVSALCEVVQLSPAIPGDSSLLDFFATAVAVVATAALGLGLRWITRQDFEDRPLWAHPWRSTGSLLSA